MFPRLCKLCFTVADESIVNIRRSAIHSRSVQIYDHERKIDPVDQDDNEVLDKPKAKRKLIIKSKRPEFNFYEGDVYPKFETIPLVTRGWHHRDSRGDHFTIYPMTNQNEETVQTTFNFSDLKLNQTILKNLEEQNKVHPTLIQKKGIPKILRGESVVMTAETGSGKTYAYLIPLIQQILDWKPYNENNFNKPLGLILTPSRELTQQISKVAKQLCKGLDIKIGTLVGGHVKQRISNPHVGEVDLLIATSGVLGKFVATRIYKLDNVRHVVVDEADTLLDSTFIDETCRILKKINFQSGDEKLFEEKFPRAAQLTLNSATVPQDLPNLLQNIVNTDTLTRVVTGNQHRINVPQKFLRVGKSDKPMMLLKHLKSKIKNKTPIIIFCNNTATCDFTKIFLKQFNVDSVNLHGKMPLEVRKGKFLKFQNGQVNILTTTDAGSRGLDTIYAKEIINFDFPLITAEYIHRCGRLGRIGSPMECRVLNFISGGLEVVMSAKIEFAVRKMHPIPMVDLINDGKNEGGEFLKHTTTVEGNDNEEDDIELEENSESFVVPH
ncbi:hypothetical protein TKK_0008254 [Trichogramma kaykai]|uniref:RNA helicase n=1 Tax=Trichogramma kaykai TaxID=54128 RepID=A0ABD2X651_9HYME